MSSTNCTDSSLCSNARARLEYIPSQANGVFLGIFLVCLGAQIIYLPLRRIWGYSIGLICAFFLEFLGYIAKLQLRADNQSSSAYIIGVLFVSLSRFIWYLGRQFSVLPPSFISWAFILADFLSLAAVGVGGSLAAIYAPDLLGPYIMVGGVAGQAFFIMIFCLLGVDYWSRRKRRFRQDVTLVQGCSDHFAIKRFAWVVALSSLLMLIRAGYRIAELSKGFNGPLAQNETLFFIFDSTPVTIAAIALTVFPPHQDIWYSKREAEKRWDEGL